MQRVATLRLPTIYQFPEVAEESGFVGYGDFERVHRHGRVPDFIVRRNGSHDDRFFTLVPGRLVVPAVLPPALVLGCPFVPVLGRPFAVELECAVLPVLE
jgi:hypothetical protein